MASTLHSFASAADLARSLADKVADTLAAAIAARGTASIAVSGGSTPKAFSRRFRHATSPGKK